MLNEETDIITEIKSNTKLTKNEQIKKYKDYLLNDCNYRLPDIFLELVARDKLDYKYTQEELNKMREQFNIKKEEIEDQNKLADIKEEQEKNHKMLIKEI